jgi:hypothetical protein
MLFWRPWVCSFFLFEFQLRRTTAWLLSSFWALRFLDFAAIQFLDACRRSFWRTATCSKIYCNVAPTGVKPTAAEGQSSKLSRGNVRPLLTRAHGSKRGVSSSTMHLSFTGGALTFIVSGTARRPLSLREAAEDRAPGVRVRRLAP